MRIANLPWYDFEELSAATDALWRGVRHHLAKEGVDDLPESLDRKMPHVEQWRRPELLLSQACGYDVLYDAAADLQVVATPRFESDGCEGANYRSAIVVRTRDHVASLSELRGRVAVVNEASSHSGTNALRPLVAPLARRGRFFSAVFVSGDHVSSLEMVRDGRADVACVDVVVLDLCRLVRPKSLEGLELLQLTEAAPAPPYVTSATTPAPVVAALRRALAAAMEDPALVLARSALRVGGIELLPADAYSALARFEEPALKHGYFELPAPSLSPVRAPDARDAPPAFRVRSRCAAR
jgi:ABC-type phosphate/phosphonate transport system substrate-binding protein